MDPDRLQRGSIVLDAPEHVPPVWGEGEHVLWAEGEPLFLAGPPGVGKTTIAQQVALTRACIPRDLSVLGYSVTPDPDRRTLYVAADRPRQALRSMRRMVGEGNRTDLAERLAIWEGAFDAISDPDGTIAFFVEHSIGTVVFDSVKDVAGDVTDAKIGAAFNRTLQAMVAAGIEVAATHHSRKSQIGNPKPTRLDDLYGSMALGAGAGSVISLWGEAGIEIVELRHLKQPNAEVGPLTVEHDHGRGISITSDGSSLRDILVEMSGGGTAKEFAAKMFATSSPSSAEVERARRQLQTLYGAGEIDRIEGRQKKAPVVYRVKDHDAEREATRAVHEEDQVRTQAQHASFTSVHTQGSEGGPPLKGAVTQPV